MTREEAMHIVDIAFDIPQAVRRVGEDRTYHKKEIREAKDMAIKALEQQRCDDAISRQAAIDIVRCDVLSAAIIYGRTEEGMSARKAIVNGLKRLPSVSTEKTGRWHKKYDSIVNDYFWECDTCKCGFQRDYPYCPNCGARMVEPQPYVPEINVGKMGESEE